MRSSAVGTQQRTNSRRECRRFTAQRVGHRESSMTCACPKLGGALAIRGVAAYHRRVM
jgi:hypothetical protein